MKNRLIAMTLILAAMLMPIGVPSVQGGKYSSYDTTWTMSCGPNGVSGTLTLSTRKGPLKSETASCSSSGTTYYSTGVVNTLSAPTNWTWSSSACYTSVGTPASSILGKVGLTLHYNCNELTGPLLSSGEIGAGVPVGVK